MWIASPYFVPDSRVVSSLVIAGLRGADVRILLPGRPDHLVVWLASFSYLAECERAGVKFYPSPKVGVRFGARWTPDYIKSDAAGWWCDPFWGCYVVGDAQYANLLDLSGGVTFR